MIELLAPAGNMEKLKTALHFGADAVYLSGKNYGLRAFIDNFDEKELKEAVEYTHGKNKKLYVTLNIFAYDEDFIGLEDYISFLDKINVDAVIVSDIGIMELVKKTAPNLHIHLSTQANTTNKYSAKFWEKQGVKRIVVARELSLPQISDMREFLSPDVEIEAFVHGAMCISYSGRCLLSNYMANRASNHGQCAQSCRWEYTISETSRGEPMTIEEDNRGTYILNSKDLNMIEHIDKLDCAGVTSFKIEGRVKSPYYVASVVNAYRRALDTYYKEGKSYVVDKNLVEDLLKTSHRMYCTGFYLKDNKDTECYETSKPKQEYDFCALVTDTFDGGIIVEQRNRFKVGDELEILSNNSLFNQKIQIEKMQTLDGEEITDALKVQQTLKIFTDYKLSPFDILRKKS